MARTHESFTNTHDRKAEHRASRRIVGGLVGAAVAGGAALGLAGCDTASNEPIASNTPGVETEAPTTSASATPEVSQTPELNPEELRIPGDLPTEELVTDTMDLISEWIYAGATEDTIAQTKADRRASDLSLEDFLAQRAEQNAKPFAEALFPDGWEQDPDLIAIYDNFVQQNVAMMTNAIGRFTRKDPLFTEERTIKVTTDSPATDPLGEQPAPDGERTVWFRMTQTFSQEDAGAPIQADYFLTFDVSDGTARLIDYTVANIYRPTGG